MFVIEGESGQRGEWSSWELMIQANIRSCSTFVTVMTLQTRSEYRLTEGAECERAQAVLV